MNLTNISLFLCAVVFGALILDASPMSVSTMETVPRVFSVRQVNLADALQGFIRGIPLVGPTFADLVPGTSKSANGDATPADPLAQLTKPLQGIPIIGPMIAQLFPRPNVVDVNENGSVVSPNVSDNGDVMECMKKILAKIPVIGPAISSFLSSLQPISDFFNTIQASMG